MNQIRINVLGASGSGASTIGRQLASALALSYFDADDYFHAPTDPPFQRPRSAQDRFELITQDLSPHSNWVLGGGMAGWEPCPRLDFCWMVFLYVPTELRVERLRRREYERFGERIKSGGDMHLNHEEFIQWASRYDIGDVEGKTLARHETYLSQQACPVFEFRGQMSRESIVERVLQNIAHDRDSNRQTKS